MATRTLLVCTVLLALAITGAQAFAPFANVAAVQGALPLQAGSPNYAERFWSLSGNTPLHPGDPAKGGFQGDDNSNFRTGRTCGTTKGTRGRPGPPGAEHCAEFYAEQQALQGEGGTGTPQATPDTATESASIGPIVGGGEWQSYDGFFNNIAHPEWGRVDSPLSRRLPTAYCDGTYAPSGCKRPNPRLISLALQEGTTGHSSYYNRTAFMVFYGQQVVEEILDSQRPGCPPEYVNIRLPTDDPLYGEGMPFNPGFIPLHRSRYNGLTGNAPNNPRQQLNEITPWFDGGLHYGVLKAWADALRRHSNAPGARGQMASAARFGSVSTGRYVHAARDGRAGVLGQVGANSASAGGGSIGKYPARNSIGLPMANPPPPQDWPVLKSARRFFMLGNPRGNENPFLLAMGIMWFRNHNWWAADLEARFPYWDDEMVFNRARQFNIADHQHVTLNEWLPAFVGCHPTIKNIDATRPPTNCIGPNGAALPQASFNIRGTVRANIDCPEWTTALQAPERGQSLDDANAWLPWTGRFNEQRNCPGASPLWRVAHWGGNSATGGECLIGDTPVLVDGQYLECAVDCSTPERAAANGCWTSPHVDYNPRAGEGYSGAIFPGVTNVYQSAAQRWGHTVVTPGVLIRDNQCRFAGSLSGDGISLEHVAAFGQGNGVRTCNAFWNSPDIMEAIGMENFMQGMASQLCEREDNIITEDLRGFVFGSLEFNRRDLMAVNIVRAREHGLPDYNTARFEYGMGRKTSWYDINPPLFHRVLFETGRNLVDVLRELYGPDDGCHPDQNQRNPETCGIDDCDIWACGLLETRPHGAGELFRTVIVDQYYRAKRADRFWYENWRAGNYFTREEITDRITRTKMSDILFRVLDTANGGVILQDDVFFHVDADILANPGCEQPFQLNGTGTFNPEVTAQVGSTNLIDCSPPMHFDYYRDTTSTGAQVGIDGMFVAMIVFMMWFAYYGLPWYIAYIKLQNRRGGGGGGGGKDPKKVEEARKVGQFFKNAHNQVVKEKRPDGQYFYTWEGNSDANSKEVQAALLVDQFSKLLGERKPTKFSMHMFNAVCHMFPDTRPTQAMREGPVLTFFQFASMLNLLKTGSAGEKRDFLFNVYATHASSDAPAPSALVAADFFELNREAMHNMNMHSNKGFDVFVGKVTSSRFPINGNNDQFAGWMRGAMKKAGIDDVMADMSCDFQYEDPDDPHHGIKRVTIGRDRKRVDKSAWASFRGNADTTQGTDDDKSDEAKWEIEERAERRKHTEYSSHTGIGCLDRQIDYVSYNLMTTVWIGVFVLMNLGVAMEIMYRYAYKGEARGLRTIAGYGITVTRGAASGIMVNLGLVLFPLCENFITKLHSLDMQHYLPLDERIPCHIAFGAMMAFFVVVHIVGHNFNFYHVSAIPQFDANCLFREVYLLSDQLGSFGKFWFFGTVTGFSSFLVTAVSIVFYICALPIVRKYSYFRVFKSVHITGAFLIYLGSVVHGAAALVQRPVFYQNVLVPGFFFLVDKLISIHTVGQGSRIVRAGIYPSKSRNAFGVLAIWMEKPKGFSYRAGQYISIKCNSINSAWHPFTMSSSPDEPYISLHMQVGKNSEWLQELTLRCLGPDVLDKWKKSHKTAGLWRRTDIDFFEEKRAPPLLNIRGPVGGANEDWLNYDSVVLAAGGIGVTPGMGVTKDLLFRLHINLIKSHLRATTRLKKIYFLWFTREPEQFEWFADLVQEMHDIDTHNVLELHFFNTSARQKNDVRQLMLYVFDRTVHFELGDAKLETHQRDPDVKNHVFIHFGRARNSLEVFFGSVAKNTERNAEESNLTRQATVGVNVCGAPRFAQAIQDGADKNNAKPENAGVHIKVAIESF